MNKLNNSIRFEEESMIAMILTPTTEMTVDERYKSIRDIVVAEIEPQLKSYLESLQLKEKLQAVSTIEELEAMQFTYIPNEVKKNLATTLDKINDLTEGQAMYFYSLFLGSYHESAAGFVNSWCQNRAQEIFNFKKRIIT